MRGGSLVAEQLGFLQDNGGSIPTSPLQFVYRPISSQSMNKMVVENHYAHRAVPSNWSFGAYFGDHLMGVISFGKPASRPLSVGICGYENEPRIYELNRLWMADICPKNSESRFISWSLRELRKMKPPLILVSFADTGAGHKGTIYAATNWTYTGLSDARPGGDKSVGGKHSRWGCKDGAAVRVERTRKHRFVYFCDPSDVRFLKYPVTKWSNL